MLVYDKLKNNAIDLEFKWLSSVFIMIILLKNENEWSILQI